MIKLRNLNKYFFKGKKNQIHVLNDVSLELEEKGLVAIHGASGSGKTTLLNVIGGLDKTNSGEIDFFEEYIPKYKSRVWDKIRNESVGFVFQNYYLLPNLSVYENVRLVLKNIGLSDEKEIETRVNYVLTALGMYSFRKKKALQLSGGQQQRVAIARALVKNPKVIIADEPTGNLDSKNTIEIMNIIKEISKETLVILVTHENEIANVYADRIITLEDGKIISDNLNEERKEHNVVDDTIYLKDIKNQEEIANEKVKINVYYNKDLKDVNVKLILKNNTLYVDVDGYKDVKLVNNAKDVVIKDAHYVKKTREEVTKTSFDVNVLDHKNVKREKKFLFSIKSLFLDVFKKLLTYGRKGKLMLFSFLIAGMIVAFSVSSFAAVLIIDAEDTISLPKGYIEYYYEDPVTIDELMSAKGSATEFYINPYYQNVPIEFLKSDGTVGITENNHVDKIEHAKKYKLIKGRHATEINEIVVSKGFADAFLGSAKAQEFGIWSLNDLFKEKINFTNVDAKIVGVVDKSTPLIFASEEFLVYNYNFSHYYTFKPVEAFTDFVPIKGTLPANSKDILINEISLNNYDKDINTVTFPFTATFPEPANGVDTLFNVVGVHDVEGVDVILKSDDIKGFIIDMYPYGHIYTDKPKETITNLNNLGLEAVDIFSEAMQELKMSRTQVLASTAISTLILVGATLVGFYFIIKSSLIEKIFEVAVLRSLGVKKREIMGSFMVEIIVLTTISSFIGYSLMSYILSLISKGFIGMFISFKVNPLTYLSGLILIYMLNLLAGLLPVFGLLRKTPAQILTQYDI